MNGDLLNFVEKTVVDKGNLDALKFGKGALSANDIFSATTPRHPEPVASLFWVAGGVNAGMVEKIWLSGDERLLRISLVISGAKGNVGNRPESIERRDYHGGKGHYLRQGRLTSHR